MKKYQDDVHSSFLFLFPVSIIIFPPLFISSHVINSWFTLDLNSSITMNSQVMTWRVESTWIFQFSWITPFPQFSSYSYFHFVMHANDHDDESHDNKDNHGRWSSFMIFSHIHHEVILYHFEETKWFQIIITSHDFLSRRWWWWLWWGSLLRHDMIIGWSSQLMKGNHDDDVNERMVERKNISKQKMWKGGEGKCFVKRSFRRKE